MIRAAVLAGKRVGVTASSHKVVQNLFDAVREQAAAAGETIQLGRKPKDDEDVPPDVRPFKSNEAALAAVRAREVHVLGGTAWLWADEAATAAVDLSVRRRGRTVLARQHAGRCASRGQPWSSLAIRNSWRSHRRRLTLTASKCRHWRMFSVDSETMPAALGIFMPETWRLAPSVCDFTSELFYGGRLRPIEALVNQRVTGAERTRWRRTLVGPDSA